VIQLCMILECLVYGRIMAPEHEDDHLRNRRRQRYFDVLPVPSGNKTRVIPRAAIQRVRLTLTVADHVHGQRSCSTPHALQVHRCFHLLAQRTNNHGRLRTMRTIHLPRNPFGPLLAQHVDASSAFRDKRSDIEEQQLGNYIPVKDRIRLPAEANR
jgi:hypothetical protein